MPRPKKIHKKKSFMFTSKHQSENGIISMTIGLISLAAIITSVIISFLNRGDAAMKLGSVGFFAAIGDVVGVIAAVIGMQERDTFIWIPRAGLIINILMLAAWAGLVILGFGGN